MRLHTRIISLSLTLLTALLLTGCSFMPDLLDSAKRQIGQIVGGSGKPTQTVAILSVNDIHAAIDGMPRLAYVADSLRRIYPDFLLVSGGDNQTGNPINDQYEPQGQPVMELMNALHFDLTAVGNHEFDCSSQRFAEQIEQSRFTYINCNIIPPSTWQGRLVADTVICMPNGMRIGWLGALQLGPTGIPDSHPDKMKGFRFVHPVEAIRSRIHALRSRSDVVIALNHLGIEDDVALAHALPKHTLSLIIGGHSHTRIAKEMWVNGTLITQSEAKLKYATLTLIRRSASGKISLKSRLISLEGKNAHIDFDIRRMVDKYNSNPSFNRVLAQATSPYLNKDALGYLMADALQYATDMDIALVNPGGVRISKLPAGAITVRDVYTLDPFNNDILCYRLTGAELKDLLMAAYPEDENRPVYAAGIRMQYHTRNKNQTLDSVEVMTHDGRPLEPQRQYAVAMNSYMASVYRFPAKARGINLRRTTAQGLMFYLHHQKKVSGHTGVRRFWITEHK